MASAGKIRKISLYYKLSPRDLLEHFYTTEKLSAIEMHEKFLKDTGILVTPRSIQRNVKSLGLSRSLSEAFTLAIKRGRKSYDHLKKEVKSSELRKGINLKVRYETLRRDNFRCVLCGNTAKDVQLEIDHIIPVVRGGSNDKDNLRVLCRACNKGKKIVEREK